LNYGRINLLYNWRE